MSACHLACQPAGFFSYGAISSTANDRGCRQSHTGEATTSSTLLVSNDEQRFHLLDTGDLLYAFHEGTQAFRRIEHSEFDVCKAFVKRNPFDEQEPGGSKLGHNLGGCFDSVDRRIRCTLVGCGVVRVGSVDGQHHCSCDKFAIASSHR